MACTLGVAVFGVPAIANADQPTKGGCPLHTWALNGPAQWLEATRVGILAEGSTVEEQAAVFGFEGNVAGFEAWIIEGVFGEAVGVDANGDGLVCRSTNTPSGYPEFYFQVHDNKHHAKFAG
jgi:hypothetical protein